MCGTEHNILYDNALYGKIFKKYGLKIHIRVVVGALAIIALTYLTGSRDYNGSGMDIIEHAVVGGHAKRLGVGIENRVHRNNNRCGI